MRVEVVVIRDIAMARCQVDDDDTAILDSVWSAFERVAAEFPENPGVIMTLQYHRWYTAQRLQHRQPPA